jgi:hypothetical protein
LMTLYFICVYLLPNLQRKGELASEIPSLSGVQFPSPALLYKPI